ncbi:MAG TPA: hypothetical protein VII06_29165 [Chloroflexota bacterium]|jgi:hypothetical protein
MKLLTLRTDCPALSEAQGKILCHDVRGAGRRGGVLFKGSALSADDVRRLGDLPAQEVHLVSVEPGDVPEDEAARRIAQAVSGPGIERKGPHQSRFGLTAAHRGVLRVKPSALWEIDCVEHISIYTWYDGQVVDRGDEVGAAKVTPLVIEEAAVREVERIAREHAPVVDVAAFMPHTVGMVVSEQLDARSRTRFEESIRERLAWFGSDLLGVRYVDPDGAAVAAAVRELLAASADLLLTGGGNAIDPADPMLLALRELNTPLEKHGVPAHPGSMLWLAYLGETPMLGLPSCGMYSRATAMDIVLPQLLTGRRLRRADLAALRHGGHLTRAMEFRFAPYESAE